MNTAVKSAWLFFVLFSWAAFSSAATMSIPSTLLAVNFEAKSKAYVLNNATIGLYSNKGIANNVNFVAGKTYKFSIAASGTPAAGAYPAMTVAIDGIVIKTINITSTSFKTYSFTQKIIKGGTRKLTLAFINDLNTGTQDRNLFIKSLAIASTTTTSTAAPIVSAPAKPTTSVGVLFQELFNTAKYYLSSNTTDVISQLRQNGWGLNNEGVDGPLQIVPWPANSSLQSIQQTYVNSDDGAKYRRYLSPYNKTEIWAAWDEYRSADFDFGSTKDGAVNLFNTNVPHSGQMIHLYWGMSTGLDSAARTSGRDDARIVDVNIQSLYNTAPSQQWSSGDANIVAQTNWAMKRATVYRFKVHIKLNTPGYTVPGNPNASNGVMQIWANGTKILERTNIKFFTEGSGNYYIHSFQLGMSATNGGMKFANPSEIYRRNIVISDKEVN